jgi:hypothetical protein
MRANTHQTEDGHVADMQIGDTESELTSLLALQYQALEDVQLREQLANLYAMAIRRGRQQRHPWGQGYANPFWPDEMPGG